MFNRLEINFTFKRTTPEYALAILGFMYAAQAEREQLADADKLQEIREMELALKKGFAVPLASRTEDGEMALNYDMPVTPSLFNVYDWSRLLNGLEFHTNLQDLTPEDDSDIHFKAWGVNETQDTGDYLALFRFLNEHLVEPEGLTSVMAWSDVDETNPGNFVIFKQGKDIGYLKHVGDIDQPLDLRWDLEKVFSDNAQLIMTNFMQKYAPIVRDGEARAKDKRRVDSKEFIGQTTLNKLLIQYLDSVTTSDESYIRQMTELFEDEDGPEIPVAEEYYIHPGLVHILSGLMAISIKRLFDAGVPVKPVLNAKRKYAYGNAQRLWEIYSDLDILLPFANQAGVKAKLDSYLSQLNK